MNKKLILLMLALPLILMLSLFTATSTVSLTIKVPVERVEINDDPVVYIDLEETYEINYTIYPTNAANKNVIFSTKQVGNETEATLKFEDGKIVPQSCGKAQVFVTADGGYQDSFIVIVSTDSLQSIVATLSVETIKIGETANISTDFIPAGVPYNHRQLGYRVVEGADVARVNTQGVVTGIGVGNATIRVYCMVNADIYAEVKITVERSSPMEFSEKAVMNTTLQAGGSIGLSVDEETEFTHILEVLDENGALSGAISYTLDKTNGTLTYEFKEGFTGVVQLRLTVMASEETFTDVCKITRVSKIDALWDNNNPIAIKVGDTEYIRFNVIPSGVDVEYEITLSNEENYISYVLKDGCIVATAEKMGPSYEDSYVVVTLTIWAKDKPDEKIVLEKIVNTYEIVNTHE